MQLSRFLCISLLAAALSAGAQAQVIGRPVDAKPLSATNGVASSTLSTVARLTAQNRGNDALITLQNAVDSGVIASDHRSLSPLSSQDLATIDLLKSGKPLTAPQVMQVVSRLSIARRGDEAVNLYTQALKANIIKATP